MEPKGQAAEQGLGPGRESQRVGLPAIQHVAFIHALRGLASLLVVWAHLGAIWPRRHGEVSYLNLVVHDWLVSSFRLYQDGGRLGVVLFFLVSGYIITFTSMREDRRAFAIKRVMRLGPPLIAAMAVTWLCAKIVVRLGSAPFGSHLDGVGQLILGLTLLDGWVGPRAMEVTWTLVIEVIFYSLTFAFLGMSRNSPERATWIMTGTWAAITLIVAITPGLSTSENSWLPRYVGFLLMGRCIFLHQSGKIRLPGALLHTSLTALVFMSFAQTFSPGHLGGATSPAAEPIYSYAWAIVIFLAFLYWAPSRTVQPFTMLGNLSYSLYLLHIPVGFLVLEVTTRLGFASDLKILLAISASFVAAWICYQTVEQPAQRLARRYLRRHTAVDA